MRQNNSVRLHPSLKATTSEQLDAGNERLRMDKLKLQHFVLRCMEEWLREGVTKVVILGDESDAGVLRPFDKSKTRRNTNITLKSASEYESAIFHYGLEYSPLLYNQLRSGQLVQLIEGIILTTFRSRKDGELDLPIKVLFKFFPNAGGQVMMTAEAFLVRSPQQDQDFFLELEARGLTEQYLHIMQSLPPTDPQRLAFQGLGIDAAKAALQKIAPLERRLPEGEAPQNRQSKPQFRDPAI